MRGVRSTTSVIALNDDPLVDRFITTAEAIFEATNRGTWQIYTATSRLS